MALRSKIEFPMFCESGRPSRSLQLTIRCRDFTARKLADSCLGGGPRDEQSRCRDYCDNGADRAKLAASTVPLDAAWPLKSPARL